MRFFCVLQKRLWNEIPSKIVGFYIGASIE